MALGKWEESRWHPGPPDGHWCPLRRKTTARPQQKRVRPALLERRWHVSPFQRQQESECLRSASTRRPFPPAFCRASGCVCCAARWVTRPARLSPLTELATLRCETMPVLGYAPELGQRRLERVRARRRPRLKARSTGSSWTRGRRLGVGGRLLSGRAGS